MRASTYNLSQNNIPGKSSRPQWARSIFFIFVLSTTASATTNGLEWMDLSSAQTPFENMRGLFAKGQPMRISQFPTPTDRDLKSWHCTYVTKHATRDQLVALAYMNAQVQVKIVTIPGVPAKPPIPGNGPAFPPVSGSPAVPPQYKTIAYPVFIPTDGSFNATPEDIGAYLTAAAYKVISTNPGFSCSQQSDPGNEDSREMFVMRQFGGAMISRVTYSSKSGWQFYDYNGQPDGKTSYTYCWKDQ